MGLVDHDPWIAQDTGWAHLQFGPRELTALCSPFPFPPERKRAVNFYPAILETVVRAPIDTPFAVVGTTCPKEKKTRREESAMKSGNDLWNGLIGWSESSPMTSSD